MRLNLSCSGSPICACWIGSVSDLPLTKLFFIYFQCKKQIGQLWCYCWYTQVRSLFVVCRVAVCSCMPTSWAVKHVHLWAWGNYNTKPRELAGATDALVRIIAKVSISWHFDFPMFLLCKSSPCRQIRFAACGRTMGCLWNRNWYHHKTCSKRCSEASASSIIDVTGVPKHSSLGKMDTCYHRQRCTQAALQTSASISQFDHQQCNSPLDDEAAIRVSRSAMKSCTSCKNLSFSNNFTTSKSVSPLSHSPSCEASEQDSWDSWPFLRTARVTEMFMQSCQ